MLNLRHNYLELLVDDGVQNRGYREKLFNPDFHCCGVFSGSHKDFDTMSVIDYAAAFIKAGEEDPIERQMDEFLKEEVEFENMLLDIRDWKQNSKI